MKGKFIAYYRVSTAKQGRSGLGLEAQRRAVEDYLNGGRWKLLQEFTEVESGKHAHDRPQLTEALHLARVTGATLVIAKLDRLSRNAAFLLTLRDSGVSFVAADLPDANHMVVGVMALIAQHEREAISKRTKEALQAAKRRGVILGNPKVLEHCARRGRATRRA
jgi:DNA invertase Pin-like site-specific DNA recombinase